MKLTVIGQWGGYPKANEASSGYLLEHDGFTLLIDCGSGVLSLLQNYISATDIDAVILSHYHPDHIADIGVLQHALLIQSYLGKQGNMLPVYAHNEDKDAFSKLSYKNVMEGKVYDPSSTLKVGPYTISFLRTKHPVPCYSMRIEAAGKVIVYTADSAFQQSFIPFSDGADLLLAESNFYGDMDGSGAGHMTSLEVARIAKEAKVKKLVLTHLPQFGDIDQLKTEAESTFTGQTLLAHKGLTVEI
jgi:ribonuclease BN (tRNA processing enzyme)